MNGPICVCAPPVPPDVAHALYIGFALVLLSALLLLVIGTVGVRRTRTAGPSSDSRRARRIFAVWAAVMLLFALAFCTSQLMSPSRSFSVIGGVVFWALVMVPTVLVMWRQLWKRPGSVLVRDSGPAQPISSDLATHRTRVERRTT